MPEERRGLDRRVFELEQKMQKLVLSSALTEAKVDGLVQTIDSRFKAFDRGVELILERLKPLDTRLASLEAVRYKAAGALWLVGVLGITGIIGGIVAIIRMVNA